MRSSKSIPRRWLVTTLFAMVAVLTISSSAFAFGSVRLKQTTVDEADGRWRVAMDVDYGSKPHLGHMPFDFVFQQKVYYEYSITDGDKEPQIRPKPVVNQQPQREQMDIGFSDARGDTWQRTKFNFSLRRDRGFEAGEYTLKIMRSSDGQQMGQQVNIILKGQNKLVDRRSLDFTQNQKAADRKSADAKPASAEAPAGATNDTASDSEGPATDLTTESTEGPTPAGTIEERPGGHGCGCRTQAASCSWWPLAIAAGLAGAIAARRRRAAH